MVPPNPVTPGFGNARTAAGHAAADVYRAIAEVYARRRAGWVNDNQSQASVVLPRRLDAAVTLLVFAATVGAGTPFRLNPVSHFSPPPPPPRRSTADTTPLSSGVDAPSPASSLGRSDVISPTTRGNCAGANLRRRRTQSAAHSLPLRPLRRFRRTRRSLYSHRGPDRRGELFEGAADLPNGQILVHLS
ncbi:hypothetical protein ACEPAF_6107 [Sanghuangporus sanghuang]